jgi:GNAT superfamily N-acetyltransferase
MAETITPTDTVTQASIALRETLDPDHSLPRNIGFEVVETHNFENPDLTSSWDKFYIEEDREPIGSAHLIVNRDSKDLEENYAYLDGIKLHHSYQGKGIGLATYMWAIERAWEAGVPFRTQTVSQSPDAKQMWEYLESKGVAVCEEPFELDYHRDGRDRFMGKYVVPLPEL